MYTILSYIFLLTIISVICVSQLCNKSKNKVVDIPSENYGDTKPKKRKFKANSTKNTRHKSIRKTNQKNHIKKIHIQKKNKFECMPNSNIIISTHVENVSNDTLCCLGAFSIKQCQAIQRIIDALQYYEPINTIKGNNKSNICILLEYIHSEYKSKQLLDDFIHIKTMHNNKLEKLQKFVMSSLNKQPCNINHCISLVRHNRDRNCYKNKCNDMANDDQNWIFIRDTFDNIHSYLFHTFDLGLRIKQLELEKIKHIHQDKNEDCIDLHLKNIAHVLRKNHKKIKTFGRFKTNKYNIDNKMTTLPGIEEKHEECTWTDSLFVHMKEYNIGYKAVNKLREFIHEQQFDTDAITNDVKDYIDDLTGNNTNTYKNKRINCSNLIQFLNNDKTKLSVIARLVNDSTLYESAFSTGFMFFYWPYYKNKTHIRHNYDLNDSPKHLYISPKYATIKEEVLNNIICVIDEYAWNDAFDKAKEFIETEKVKSMSSCGDYIHSGIKQHSHLTVEHLICVILYCDYSELSTAFSSTFRRNRSFELISSVKKRNREYWHLSKLLRETVELWGEHKGYFDEINKKWTGVTGPFYCGMSFVCIIPQFNIRLFGPTSTSKCIEVATRFGGDHGIIIELNNDGNCNSEYLRCFNCSWISNYNSEEERLFFGGRHRIKVESVRDIEMRKDFKKFFHALFYFDCMLNGSDMQHNIQDEICVYDLQIMEKLIQHKLKKKCNEYMDYLNKTFEIFCNQRRKIVFNLHYMETYFYKLRYLLFKSNSNLPKTDLFHLFKNLETMTLDTTNRIPYIKYDFPLLKLCQLLNSSYIAGNVQIIVKAYWETSYDYHIVNRSWIYGQLLSRTILNPRIYITQLTSKRIQNRFPIDCFTILKA